MALAIIEGTPLTNPAKARRRNSHKISRAAMSPADRYAADGRITKEMAGKIGASAEIINFSQSNDKNFETLRITNHSIQERLYNAKLLDPERQKRGDNSVADSMRDAADRFFGNWYLGGCAQRITVNMHGVSRMADGNPGMPSTEKQMLNRQRFRAAWTHLVTRDPRSIKYVYECVINERDPVDVAREYSHRRDPAQLRAVALDNLTAGLLALVEHYERGKK